MKRLAAVVVLASCTLAHAGEPENLRVLLKEALPRKLADGSTRRSDVVLDIPIRDGKPDGAAWAHAPGYNRADHKGTVTRNAPDAGKWHVSLPVRGDAWVGGGDATFDLAVSPFSSVAPFGGSFSGSFGGKPVEGQASAIVTPLYPAPLAGYKAIEAGEHPRLLVRKADLPALRKRVASGDGAKMVEILRAAFAGETKGFGYGKGQAGAYGQANHAAAHAMLYMLEGKPEEAQRARELAIEAMHGNCAQDELFYCGYVMGVALAYDMCYDGWEPAFRQAVAAWLERFAWDITHNVRDWRPQNMSTGIEDMNVYGTELIMNRAAAGMAALAILNDPLEFPGEVPAERSAFFSKDASPNDTDSPHELRYHPATGMVMRDPGFYPRPTAVQAQADASLADAKGVPVIRYTHDRILTQFLVARLEEDPAWRPFAPAGKDPLESLGGSAKARPTPGTSVTYREKSYTFAPLDPADVYHDNWTDHREAINLLHPENMEKQTLDYHYAIIENDTPRFARLMLGNRYLWWPNVYLGGEAVKENQVVFLPKGRIPLLIQTRVPIQQTYAPYFPAFYGNSKYKHRALDGLLRNNWFYNYATLEDTAIPTIPLHPMWFAPRFVDAADPKVEWTRARDAWASNGKTAATAADSLEVVLRSLKRYADAGMGDRGWWNGNNGYEDTFEMVFPFALACRNAVGRDVVSGTALEWAIVAAIVADGFGVKTTDTNDWRYTFPIGLSTVRPEHLPVVRHVIENGIRPYSIANPMHACVAMASYPYDVKAVDPQAGLPLTWIDSRNGGYVFRNNYDMRGKVVCVVERGGRPLHTATQAGGFSINAANGAGYPMPFGRQFGDSVGGGGVWRNAHYGDADVVLMEGTLPAGGAKEIACETSKDGSGVVSLDTSAAYWSAEADRFENPGAQGWGVRWGAHQPKDLGIKALRSIAVDYSGASGASAMIAVADRFAGDGGRQKTWQLHIANRDYTMKFQTRPVTWDAAKRRFTVYGHWVSVKDPAAQASPKMAQADEWMMEGTVVSPADAAFAYKDGVLTLGSKSSEFLVVMTLNRGGGAPAPVATGEGLASRVTVGGQTIGFDAKAQKLMLAPSPK